MVARFYLVYRMHFSINHSLMQDAHSCVIFIKVLRLEINLKKGQEIVGVVREVQFPNKAVVETDEGNIVVKNALPGWKIKARILKLRKGKPEGILLEVLDMASDSVEAQCPHFGICGGCTFLTMKYEAELNLKEQEVRKLLDKVIERDSYVWEPIKRSPVISGYRNKMEFPGNIIIGVSYGFSSVISSYISKRFPYLCSTTSLPRRSMDSEKSRNTASPVLFTPNPLSQRSFAAREATSRGTRFPNAG